MILIVVVHLELGEARFIIALHAEVVLGLLVSDRDLFGVPIGGCSFGQELTLACVFEGEKQEGGFIDGPTDGQEAVIAEDASFVVGETVGMGRRWLEEELGRRSFH